MGIGVETNHGFSAFQNPKKQSFFAGRQGVEPRKNPAINAPFGTQPVPSVGVRSAVRRRGRAHDQSGGTRAVRPKGLVPLGVQQRQGLKQSQSSAPSGARNLFRSPPLLQGLPFGCSAPNQRGIGPLPVDVVQVFQKPGSPLGVGFKGLGVGFELSSVQRIKPHQGVQTVYRTQSAQGRKQTVQW